MSITGCTAVAPTMSVAGYTAVTTYHVRGRLHSCYHIPCLWQDTQLLPHTMSVTGYTAVTTYHVHDRLYSCHHIPCPWQATQLSPHATSVAGYTGIHNVPFSCPCQAGFVPEPECCSFLTRQKARDTSLFTKSIPASRWHNGTQKPTLGNESFV